MTLLANDETLFLFYAQNVRQGLFTGFLTLASFLFAMKTFIVINMKTHLYDTPHYRDIIRKKRQNKSTYPIYGSLRCLNRLLITTILLSVVSSLLQFSLGLVRRDWAAITCLSVAGITVVILIFAIVQIGYNTSTLLKEWEKEGNSKLIAEHAKAEQDKN